jgi:predicted Rossmann-fold nucleotide-binding protein
VCSHYWRGLIQWFETSLLREGSIDPDDLNLFRVLDEPHEVVNAIFSHYEQSGFEPSEQEQQTMLDL